METSQARTNEYDLRLSLIELKMSLNLLDEKTKTIGERRPKLERLERTIANLSGGKKAKKILLCPDEYLKQWQEFRAGARSTLEWRVVRYLCWEPEVVTDADFHRYLDRYWPHLNARSLQGMVRGCHLKWSRESAGNFAIECVRRRLREYGGLNRLLERWRGASTLLLGANGAKEFALEILKSSLEDACNEWNLDEGTGYVAMAAVEAAESILSARLNEKEAKQLLGLLQWRHWRPESFKRIIAGALLHPLSENRESWRNALIKCALNHQQLGDPRIDAASWAGVPEEARIRFVQWLSRADIVFFFDQVLRGDDPHGRRKFWLQYAASLRQSRPLLRSDDEIRLSKEIRRSRGGNAGYGRVTGAASALILDFGSTVALEFSTAAAIYFYDRETFNELVPDLWQRYNFLEPSLMVKERARGWVEHGPICELEAAAILASYGIRPE